MGVFGRSWDVFKLSLNVLKSDKELILFPLLSGIFSILFVVAMVVPSLIAMFASSSNDTAMSLVNYVLYFIAYLGLAFIATFFNVCTVYTAKKRFEGGNSKFGEALGFAFSRIHLIFLWSLVAATVGILLRLLDNLAEKAGPVGKVVMGIINSILGMVWSIITIFVVPAMVYENVGPFAAIKKSVQTLKKTWGESLVRHFALGIAQGVFVVIGVILTVVLVIALAMISPWGIVIAIMLAVLYFVLVFLVFSVLNSIFNTALYAYAQSGKVPNGFSQEVLQGAFQAKEKKGFMG